MKCEFCLAEIPEYLQESRRKYGGRLKYCSVLCNKRASYMRRSRPAKNSIFWGNPQTGIAWENWFISEYGATRPSRAYNTPFDFWWRGLRIDMKTVNQYVPKDKKAGQWSFMPGKHKDQVDAYLCLGLTDNKVDKIFLIPEADFHNTGITVSPRKSKWDIFLIEL